LNKKLYEIKIILPSAENIFKYVETREEAFQYFCSLRKPFKTLTIKEVKTERVLLEFNQINIKE